MSLPFGWRRAGGALALCLVAACGGGASPGNGPAPEDGAQAPETAAFVVMIGSDTLAVEQFTRTPTRITGEVVARTPRTLSRSYTADLNPDGTIARVEVTTRDLTAPPTTPPTVTSVVFGADSARMRFARGDSVRTSAIAAPASPVPFVANSYALFEHAIMRVDRSGGRTEMQLVPIGSPGSSRFAITPVGADSVILETTGGRQRVRVDAQGRILELNGLETTLKVMVARVPSVDVAALAAEFARRDATGRGVGALSPRDSAVAEVGGARVVVDYGRPFKRGRRIFGAVVPWGQVWRTGANAATALRTTRDLEIGGVSVPAGAYTLWTIPGPDGWKLVINRQTGQWGTEYHEDRDLARIDIPRRTLSQPVEQFTVALDPAGAGGTLRMAWDDTEAYVPFTVK